MEVRVVTGEFSSLQVKSWEPFTLSLFIILLSRCHTVLKTVTMFVRRGKFTCSCSSDRHHGRWVWLPAQQSVPGSAEEESGSSTAG